MDPAPSGRIAETNKSRKLDHPRPDPRNRTQRAIRASTSPRRGRPDDPAPAQSNQPRGHVAKPAAPAPGVARPLEPGGAAGRETWRHEKPEQGMNPRRASQGRGEGRGGPQSVRRARRPPTGRDFRKPRRNSRAPSRLRDDRGREGTTPTTRPSIAGTVSTRVGAVSSPARSRSSSAMDPGPAAADRRNTSGVRAIHHTRPRPSIPA